MKLAVVICLVLLGIAGRGNAAAVVTTNNLFTAPQCVHSTGPSNIEDMGCAGRTILVTLQRQNTR